MNPSTTRYLDVKPASCIRLLMDLCHTGDLTQAEYVLLEKLLAEKKMLKGVLSLDPQGFYFRVSCGTTK